MKKLLCMSLAIISFNSLAILQIDDVKDLATINGTIRVMKDHDQYKLFMFSYNYLDKDGKIIKLPNGLIENLQTTAYKEGKYILTKKIVMPITISLKNSSKIGNSVQFFGYGDDDKATGEFSNFKNKKVENLFTTFKGKSYDLGLVFIGGGYTSAISKNGVKLSSGNATVLFPGPAGMPFGVNAGVERTEFELSISSPLKAVEVNYELTHLYQGKAEYTDEQTDVLSLEDVYSMKLDEE
jgi:hypothetical protein